ncbi:Uu.00g079130.m01.CDS01 [Anthostomella pinea]|uniref:Uu.00g079130.m01.CDS01 n=1 Tax=Anthostomella pinea TaxID=933095 RepID=A0AAI8VLD7_9PEZI|nr:Uu.00g079130.m01.CDS01 [Anthostomella pinea]
MPPGDPGALLAPPEGIYRSFEDLLAAVQRVAKDQGYGVVKLRASNYRDGKPTRYDLVCDRGGVKYNSTAKKRNPSTRKVDCPWRAKAVCEVQLGNQWRFAVQDSRHNHEARVPAAPPGQENTPIAQSIRSFTHKLDRIGHDMSQGFLGMGQRLESIEKRLEAMESRMNSFEARMSGMESRAPGMDIPLHNMDMEEPMPGMTIS